MKNSLCMLLNANSYNLYYLIICLIDIRFARGFTISWAQMCNNL